MKFLLAQKDRIHRDNYKTDCTFVFIRNNPAFRPRFGGRGNCLFVYR